MGNYMELHRELEFGTWLQLMCYTPSRSHCPNFKGMELWSMELVPESAGVDRARRAEINKRVT